MKFQCLDYPESPANTFLINWNKTNILFNFPLEILGLSTLPGIRTHRDPEEEYDTKLAADVDASLPYLEDCAEQTVFRTANMSLVDVRTIDLVLISNSDMMLGLPYLTEVLGYKGRIVATEPTIEFGRQRMEELVELYQPKASNIPPWRRIHWSTFVSKTDGWRPIYTQKQVEECVKKIEAVRFGQTMNIAGTMDFVGCSSGYSLGSVNWVLESSFQKLLLMSHSSDIPDRHPARLDTSALEGADVVLVSGLRTINVADPVDVYRHMRDKALAQVAQALRKRRNVLFPIPMAGNIFDLIGILNRYLTTFNMELGPPPGQIPVYVIGHSAKKSLDYANICGEWMTTEKQEMLYLSNWPLDSVELQKKQALTVTGELVSRLGAPAITIQEPCIVFTTDHICFDKGAVRTFLRNWGNDPENVCILTEPDLSKMIPHDMPEGLKMKVLQLPWDARFGLLEVRALLTMAGTPSASHANKHILIPRVDGAASAKIDWESILPNAQVHIYDNGGMVDIDLQREWTKVEISPELARNQMLVEHPEGTLRAEMKGVLQLYNNKLGVTSREA